MRNALVCRCNVGSYVSTASDHHATIGEVSDVDKLSGSGELATLGEARQRKIASVVS